MISRTLKRLERYWETDRGLSVFLAVLLVVGFVVYPLRREAVLGDLMLSAFFSLMLISGVVAVSRRRADRLAAGVVVVANLLFRWAGHVSPNRSVSLITAFLTIAFVAMMIGIVLVQVFREGPITVHRVIGSVAVYVLLGVGWAQGYHVVALLAPGAFQSSVAAAVAEPDMMYFSFVTLTTTGYGDITAVNSIARALVALEALTGQLFPAILIARLVSMEVAARHSR